MKTSLLICATCLIVTGCSAQLRLPSLSSAFSSLTGIGGSSSNNQASSSQSSSPYSAFVRDYGRNLMTAMSSIYPTLFKPPPQQQQQAQSQSQPAPQSPYDSSFAGQFGPSQNMFSSQQSPSFSFGGSTFSISPSMPFGSMSAPPSVGQQQPMASASSPFGGSFGSSINSPPSFGSLSNSAIFGQQSVGPQFAPASSYQAALEAANGGASLHGNSQPFESIRSSPQLQSSASSLVAQPTNPQPASFSPLTSFGGAHESLGQHNQPAQQHQQHSVGQSNQNGPHSGSFVGQQHNQFGSQHYRPDMMSIAASAPIPSSNSFANYGSPMGQGGNSQQVPASSGSYQQPSYR